MAEGEAAIFQPLGDDKFKFIARVSVATWTECGEMNARYFTCSRNSANSRSNPPERIGKRHHVFGSRFSSSR